MFICWEKRMLMWGRGLGNFQKRICHKERYLRFLATEFPCKLAQRQTVRKHFDLAMVGMILFWCQSPVEWGELFLKHRNGVFSEAETQVENSRVLLFVYSSAPRWRPFSMHFPFEGHSHPNSKSLCGGSEEQLLCEEVQHRRNKKQWPCRLCKC